MGNQISSDFLQHVDKALATERPYSYLRDRIFVKTKHGQIVVFLIVQTEDYFESLLIADEDHRDQLMSNQFGVDSNWMLEQKRFDSYEAAKGYAARMKCQFKAGQYGKTIAYRIRRMPKDCITHPDKYLTPGDHIQRDTFAVNPHSHEGIYLGEGLVAHIDSDSHLSQQAIGHFATNKNASFSRIDTLEKFVDDSREIRVICYSIHRRTPDEICFVARCLIEFKARGGDFHLLWRNCRHFASYCALGRDLVIDRQNLGPVQSCTASGRRLQFSKSLSLIA